MLGEALGDQFLGRFTLNSDETVGADVILYVIAKGGEASPTGLARGWDRMLLLRIAAELR